MSTRHMSVKKNLTSKDRPVTTPGEDRNDSVNDYELNAPEEIKSFRARGNLLRMDRPDAQFSAKDISRDVSNPMKKDQRSIVRMAKYLRDPEHQRIKQEFKFEALDTNHSQSAHDSAGRARHVELYRPPMGSSSTGVPRRGWWRCRRARLGRRCWNYVRH